ncbi:MAG: DUF4886 domain-containing protein [Candidatus Cryptobacteroides sp.]
MNRLLHLILSVTLVTMVPMSINACTEKPPFEDVVDDPENPDDTDDTEDPENPSDNPEDPTDNPEDPDDPSDNPGDEPDVPDTPAPSDGIIRILAIGNSFSQDAVEQYLYELFDAAGQKVIIGNLYIGGCTLETHYKNMQSGEGKYYYRKIVDGVKTETSSVPLLTGLKDEKWDYVSLQQASGKSGQYETYNTYLPELLSFVKSSVDNPSLKLMFHQTWAYATTSTHSEFPKYDSDQMTMYNAIMSAVRQAVNDNPDISIVIPSGTAIQNGRTSYLGDSFNRDGYHLETTYGRYTAACCWYESISGNDVTSNTYAPSTVGDSEKAVAQNAAHMAVANPWQVTEMTGFKKPVSSSEEMTSPVYVDFGGGSSTAPSPWSRVASFSASSPIYIKDETGGYSPVFIESMTGFTSTFNGVGSEPDSAIEIDGISYPKATWSDAVVVGGTAGSGDVGPASIVLSGFSASSSYDVRVLAVRFNGSADARQTRYVLSGASDSEVQSVNPGLKTFDSVTDFGSYQASFKGVKPTSDGKMTLKVTGIDTGKAAEGHVSAIVISKVQ